MSASLLLLLACSGEPTPPPPTPAPEAPAPATPPPAPPPSAPAAKVLELDATGGGNGAPAGTNFIVPAGTAATTTAGPLSDGSTGFSLTVTAPGDALVCTQAADVGASFAFKARMKASVTPGPQDWMGLNVELRARDASGALVSPPGGRYVLLRNLREGVDWAEVDGTAAVPAGATKGELCFRFVGSTGALEVDRIELAGVSAEGGTVLRWELDGPGGEAGAPAGAAFYVPPGTPGVEAKAGDLGDGAKGFRLAVGSPSNALVCSAPFPATGKMEASGRVRVGEVKAGGGAYAGFTAEVRSYDAAGALVPGPGSQYIPLNVWKQAGPWGEFQVAFTTPAGAATAKVCTRFVDSTGAADVDWLAVSGGAAAEAPAVAGE